MSHTTKERFVTGMQVKALDVEDRTFEGFSATWDLDLQDDIINKGAFRKWIREWKRSGKVLPLLDSHSWFSIFDTIGKLLDVEERDQGLWTRWRVIPGPRGDEVLSLLSTEDGGPFIDSMSIGYQPRKWHFEEDPEVEGREIRYLSEIDLNEVSLVRFPANPAAMTDPESVRKALAGELEALEHVVSGGSPEVRAAVKGLLTETLARCEGGNCRTAKTSPPKDVPRPGATKSAGGGADADNDEDTDAPDPRKFDELRLRQLESRTHHTGVIHHGR